MNIRNKRSISSMWVGTFTRLFNSFARHGYPNAVRVFFHRLRGVSIGKNTFIGKYCVFDDSNPTMITIGSNVGIALNVVVLAHRRNISEYSSDKGYNDYPIMFKEVEISDNVQIGCGSIILPGVKIGRASIVAAGSVVTKDVPESVLVAGCPATIIKHFTT